MLRIRLATTAAEMEAFRPLWEELERAPGTTIFQSYAWNAHAARLFAGRESPHVLAVESDAGAVIVPAALGGDAITFLGETLFDYRDFIAQGDAGLVERALIELASCGRNLYLPAVREGSRVAAALADATAEWVGAPLLRRADISPDAFSSQHFKARKQLNRIRRAGARFERYDGEVPRLLTRLYERKAEQYRGSAVDLFSDPLRRRFMVEIAAICRDRCDVFTIEVGSALVAMLVTFRDPGVRRLYTLWHDPAWQQFSPGATLLLHACRRTLEEGMDVDFLTGEQPHKTRFATSRVQLYRLHATAARLGRAGHATPVAA